MQLKMGNRRVSQDRSISMNFLKINFGGQPGFRILGQKNFAENVKNKTKQKQIKVMS